VGEPVQIFLTTFYHCDSGGNERGPAWGYRLIDEFDSVYYDAYETLEEAVEAVSEKNVLNTIEENHPDLFGRIEADSGLVINGKWFCPDDLTPVSEAP
jgi:hypothetical protein